MIPNTQYYRTVWTTEVCKIIDSEHMYMFTSLILLVLLDARSIGVLLVIVFANCLNKCSMC